MRTAKPFPLKILPKLREFAIEKGWEPEPLAPTGREVLRLYKVTTDGDVLRVSFYKNIKGVGSAPAGDPTDLLNAFYANSLDLR